jgi:hypothetical protein
MSQRSEAGFALLGALFVLFLIAVGAALAGLAIELRLGMVLRETENLQLTALADAGLAEAMAHLDTDRSFAGLGRHAFGNGALESEVFPLGFRRFRITVTAHYRSRHRKIEATAFEDPDLGLLVVSWRVAPH